jgi:hypothetical protein
MEVDLIELKKNIFFKAERCILEDGEFEPYGAIVENDTVRMVGYNNGETESLDSKEAVRVLKKGFLERFERGMITAAAIGYDVALTTTDSDGSYTKRDALCLCISTDGDTWSEEYFPYLVLSGQCIWK